MERTHFHERPWLIRDHDAVNDRLPEGAIRRLDHLLRGRCECRQHGIPRLRPHARDNRRGVETAKRRRKCIALGLAFQSAPPATGRVRALNNRPFEEPRTRRRDEMEADTLASG
jgi:hypothetical protein